MPNIGDTQIRKIDTTKNDFPPLENANIEVSLDTPLIENESLVEKAQDIYFKTAT